MKPNLVLAGWLTCLAAACFMPHARAQETLKPYSPERRAAALKKYDKDGDGKLNEAEREAMRKAVAAQRIQAARRGGGSFMVPPEILKKYDKDGDGVLDEEESQAAREGMRKQFEEIRKKYDTNGDGNLDATEMEALQKDAQSGKLDGVPRFFGGPPRSSRNTAVGPSRDEIIQRQDKNHDGRLSAEELQAVRAEIAKQRADQAAKQPPQASPPK